MDKYENPMHVIADKLIEHFNGSEAVNYIEQIFTDNNNESNSFVLTMQKVSGLTPCQKLTEAELKIEALTESLESLIEELVYEVEEGRFYTGINGDSDVTDLIEPAVKLLQNK